MTIHVGGGGGGSSGGGTDPNMAIGAHFKTSGDIPNDPNLTLTLSLDTGGNATQIYLHGLTLNGTNDAFVVGTKGRYAVAVSGFVEQDTTDWNLVYLWADASPFSGVNADTAKVITPPTSLVDLGGPTVHYFTYTELDIGALIQFFTRQSLARAATPLRARSVSCFVQYVGPTTSI